MSQVSVVSAQSHLDLKEAIEKATELIGFQPPPNVKRIVIKPDLCYYWDYSTGQTTDPRFVAALVDFLRESVSTNAEISIVESDTKSRKCVDMFRFLGYEKLAREKDLNLINLSEDPAVKSQVYVENRVFGFMLPETVKKADLLVNVPKIKRSLGTKISCSIQNMYGCNPDPEKPGAGYQSDEMSVAFNKLFKIDLCLAEGLIIYGKRSARLGVLLSSVDPVALDSVVARILGFDAGTIGHICLSEREGIGTAKYEIRGESADGLAERFPMENAEDKIWNAVSRLGLFVFKKLGRKMDSDL